MAHSIEYLCIDSDSHIHGSHVGTHKLSLQCENNLQFLTSIFSLYIHVFESGTIGHTCRIFTEHGACINELGCQKSSAIGGRRHEMNKMSTAETALYLTRLLARS